MRTDFNEMPCGMETRQIQSEFWRVTDRTLGSHSTLVTPFLILRYHLSAFLLLSCPQLLLCHCWGMHSIECSSFTIVRLVAALYDRRAVIRIHAFCLGRFCCRSVYVCPSVCLSHACIVFKRLKLP